MKNFKVEVSKGLEKYNFVRKAESETLLRDELHKEGFSILSISEIGELDVSGNKYFFEILEKNGNVKVGTIVSNDIFKAYLKIKYKLKYDLKYIYQNKNTSLEEKEKIIKELESQYNLYLEENEKNINKKQSEIESKIKESKDDSIDSFEMKKELDNVYKIIDKVLSKLKNLLEINDSKYISLKKKELLKNIYTEIVKIKSSTNIYKLRQIGEQALSKIGEIELEILENKKNEEYKKLLSETNKLLREVGSKKYFIEKNKDLKYIFNNLLKNVIYFIKSNKKEKKSKLEIDTTSTSYLKNKLLLNKYKARLKDLKKEKIKNFLIYLLPTRINIEKKIELKLKEKVIRQNIMILKRRISGKIPSYVKIIKGYNYFVEKLLKFINFFKKPILFILFIYSFVFLIINLINSYKISKIDINFNGMFYFIYLIIILILIRLTRGIFSLILNIVIFVFLFIFGVINF